MSHDINCPFCGIELTVAQLFAHADTQRAVGRLAAVSLPLGARVLQYCSLFAPPKTRLTVPKQVKLILQLLPDMERQGITHKGRDWIVPLSVWAQGIDQMLASRDAGRLELPMSGHGYLYSVLAALADKVEGRAEVQAEAARRAPASQGTVTVKGQSMSIGQGLAQVYGGRDPELAKRENDRRSAVPMPDAVRTQLAALRAAVTAPTAPPTTPSTSGEKA